MCAGMRVCKHAQANMSNNEWVKRSKQALYACD